MTTGEVGRPRHDWRHLPEAGTILGIRFVVALATLMGRTVASGFLWVLALYYALLSARARRASREYLAKVGQAPSTANVVRHLHTFARVSLDRLFFLRGRFDSFEIALHGHEHMVALHESNRGALLLGSHVGSFEVMRAMSRKTGIRVSVVVDTRSAERLGRIIEELSPDANLTVIPVDPDGVSTALRVRDALRQGHLVGILGDRRSAEDPRNVEASVLGAQALLPAGPYLLAHTLRCPVYQVFGLFSAPNRYDLYCEPFAESVALARDDREGSLRGYAQRYADALSAAAKRAPYNWFNFYDFWSR